MPFQYLLTNLLVDIPGAQGAIFLDGEGESVAFVSRGATPFELKLEGAYHGIFLRRAAELGGLLAAGKLRHLLITGSQMKVVSRALREGYYLVVVLDVGAPVSLAEAALDRAAVVLDREIP